MIRTARQSDSPAMLELVHELAAYEREPDAVQTTVAQLTDALFGAEARAHALVAEQDGQVVGCAIWFVNFSTWTGRHGIYLEDLVVSRAYRGHGYGRQLLAALAGICVQRGYRRLEWSVLDWNEPALGFYRALGAQAMTEWTVHRVSGDALAALASAGELPSMP
jgi:GNAT superfamily N-acetyltransferase